MEKMGIKLSDVQRISIKYALGRTGGYRPPACASPAPTPYIIHTVSFE